MKRIVLTGGGTAGHVTPNMALIEELKKEDYDIHYIGSYEGIEKQLIADTEVPYYAIASGKLRRYFDWKNISDPFRVLKGFGQALRLMKKLKPDVLFSKGGFVSVPVVLAAKQCHVPVIIHESDMTPGLANKICIPAASKVCYNFPETKQYLPQEKAVLTGSPVRKELFMGDNEKGRQICHFTDEKPVVMIIGGSLGSAVINQAVREQLDDMLEDFQIIHLCGKGKLDSSLQDKQGYCQFEYVKSELCNLFAAADVVISRAGANAINEILTLKIPNILIPLSQSASRGDQILNANSFERQGFSKLILEENLTSEGLLAAVREVYHNRNTYIEAMENAQKLNPVETIMGLIREIQK
ncbi:MAG: undecaprenyldiphospho-muramoylpentapeptide beta-N-acetylglucosaminyltransferase [Lachnospiraceae bacterium]